jgi:hypothetical protein
MFFCLLFVFVEVRLSLSLSLRSVSTVLTVVAGSGKTETGWLADRREGPYSQAFSRTRRSTDNDR